MNLSFPLRPFGYSLLLCGLMGCGGAPNVSLPHWSATDPVNPSSPFGAVLPVNQIITPAGRQVDLPGLRPQAIALSPNGQLLAVTGKTSEIVILDPTTGEIRQRVSLPPELSTATNPVVSSHLLKPDTEGQVSYTGLAFAPDGNSLYLANVNGSIKVFSVDSNNVVTPSHTLALPEVVGFPRTKNIPSGLKVSPDGKRLYVVLNLSNQLLEVDLTSGNTLKKFEVGNAPYDLVLVGTKAYVSNWGGRRVELGVLSGPIGIGAKVRVDPVRHIANEGSVSVINLETGIVTSEIIVGMHSSAIGMSPDRKYVVVANANSDSLSVIETKSDRVIETIDMKWAKGDPFGASPNALVFDESGREIYVCNGTQNAVAVVKFQPGHSKLTGLIPTGWYPGAIVQDSARKSLYVANIKGWGSGRRGKSGEKIKAQTHQYFGTVSLFKKPGASLLKNYTQLVHHNYRRAIVEASQLPPRAGIAATPVPERVGEPSLINHVVYIIKENRTYDQVLGDLPQGNGNLELCTFGEKYTPNQHKLVKEFVLLDNTYCSGILSADGHQWSTTAFATDLLEKSFAGFPRSYPDGMEDADVDALAYASSGFIWDNALAHNKTLRIYGEFATSTCGWSDTNRTGSPTFADYYRDFKEKTQFTRVSSRPSIESIRGVLATNTVGWDMDVPDVIRASRFIEDLAAFEKKGEMPNLIIICLPNDHTSGTSPGKPTPGAYIADNDLAMGQIVEALSKSIFWKDSCVFAIEDDPQAGWDHVTGYRTTAYVASPYAKRGAVVSINYNQPSLLRTMELMLGLPPMNQMDAGARPMKECFTEQPNFAPFITVTNNISLHEVNPPAHALIDSMQRRYAESSAKLNLKEPDRCPEDLLNRILWHAIKGSKTKYPMWAIHEVEDDD